MIVRSGASLSLLRKYRSFLNSSSFKWCYQSEYNFSTKKRSIRYGSNDIEDDDLKNCTFLKIDMEERFAKTVHKLATSIKEELESTFLVKREDMTDEEYNDPSTKKMPLYIQPRPIESYSIMLFHGSSKVQYVPEEEIDRWYRLLVLCLEASGFVHENGSLTDDNFAHPDDYYFTFDKVITYPPKTHHLLVLQLKTSLGFHRLYEDVQVCSSEIPEVKPLVPLSISRRTSLWFPHVVLADIRNHMEGGKREEKRLREMLSERELQPLNFFPDWIRLGGVRPLADQKKYNWDFTFEHLRNAKRPTVPPPFYADDLRR